jgi:UDP-glucose 4-epimerase
MSRQSVLVTGGGGYIGSHVVLALRDHGCRLVVVDDLSTGFRDAIPGDVAFHQGDVSNAEMISGILLRHDVGAVIHLAGSVSAPESVADPLKYYSNNARACLALAEACLAGGVERFIFSSSAAVYGAATGSPIAEDAPTLPISPYGASKLMAEAMLNDLSKAHPHFRVMCLRYFNVGGADPRGRAGQRKPDAADLIHLVVQSALGVRGPVAICGDDYDTRDGTGERDYIHVCDLAEAHRAALDYLDAGGATATLNCGYGRGYTVLEVVAAMETILDRKLATCRARRRPGDPASAVSDVTRLKATFDWRPRLDSLGQILSTALAWQSREVGRTSI